MSELEAKLLALMAQHASLGNGKARELLGCDEADYGRVKQALLVSGQVVQGRGRGGSIRLAEPTGQLAENPQAYPRMASKPSIPPP